MTLVCFECSIHLRYIDKMRDRGNSYLYVCDKCGKRVLFEPKGTLLA